MSKTSFTTFIKMSEIIEQVDSNNTSVSGKVTETIQNLDEQRELFLWRFKDVDRAKVMVMYKVRCIYLYLKDLSKNFIYIKNYYIINNFSNL